MPSPTSSRRFRLTTLACAIALAGLAPALHGQQAPPSGPTDGVVRAVYFFSPTCPACQELSARHLPGILAEWGPTLDLLKVDVSTDEGGALFETAMRSWRVPRDRFGVPAIFVGERHLVGTVEIPAQLPAAIEAGVAMGGVGWPPIAGLADALPSLRSGTAGSSAGEDPLGMALGLGVLLAIAAAMGWSGLRAARTDGGGGRTRAQRRARARDGRADGPPAGGPTWTERDPWILAFAGAGLPVAGYLAWVALSGHEALCGPVGSCSVVHASRFGTIAGVPVAVFGLLFFVGVTALALHRSPSTVRGPLTAAAWAGAAFSLYLTGAEVFVIGAVCSWCLVSALLCAALLVRVSGGTLPLPAAAGREGRPQGAPG